MLFTVWIIGINYSKWLLAALGVPVLFLSVFMPAYHVICWSEDYISIDWSYSEALTLILA
jgi:hypothetical protein